MNAGKLIFLDIDGTLTIPGSNILPASAQKAIQKARENGHLIFLCTGRNYKMLSPLLSYGFDGVIGSSGGYVEVDGKVIYEHPLSQQERVRILEVLRQNQIFCTVESREGSYTDEGFKEFLMEHAGEGANSELLRWRRQIEGNLDIRPMGEYDGETAYKVIYMSMDSQAVGAAVELLNGDFSIIMQGIDQYGVTNGEIVAKGLDKGAAVARVAAYLNRSMEDTVGFGDSTNDKELLETVALGICMDNGTADLKEIADEICPAVSEDGIYRAFLAHGWICG